MPVDDSPHKGAVVMAPGCAARALGVARDGTQRGAVSEDGAPNVPSTRVAPNERVCFPTPPEGKESKQGQVLEGTSFGAALSATRPLPWPVKRVLELGTWYGGGSTVNLGQGIRDSARTTLAKSLGSSAPE